MLAMLLVSFPLHAHEMTPTYPKLVPSHMSNVYKTRMEMFNKRDDVEYYEIGVFDNEWKPIPFVSKFTVYRIEYLGHVEFDVYIRKSDVERALYVCSISKLRKASEVRQTISSRICSKFSRE